MIALAPTLTAGLISTPLIAADQVAPSCGPSWNVVSSPNAGRRDNELLAVSARSRADIWAVGHRENRSGTVRTLTEHWDGTSWTIVPSPSVGSENSYLTAVAALSPADVWAVGNSGDGTESARTLTEHWDGTSWTIVPSPNAGTDSNFLTGVTALSTDDVWAVGYYWFASPQTLIMHWDGAEWSIVPSPNPGAPAYLFAVDGTSSVDVWAAGTFLNESLTYETLYAHWNGVEWTAYDEPGDIVEKVALAVTTLSPADAWAVGRTGPLEDQTSSGMFAEHWNGLAWDQDTDPIDQGSLNILSEVAALTPSDVWAAGYNTDTETQVARTMVHRWTGGFFWSRVDTPNVGTGDNYLSGLEVVRPAGHLWAVGSYVKAATGASRTLIMCAAPRLVGNLAETVNAAGTTWRRRQTHLGDSNNEEVGRKPSRPTGFTCRSTTWDARDHTATLSYDSNSNVTQYTDGLSKNTIFDYDPSNNLEKVTLPTTSAVELSYNDGDHAHGPSQVKDQQGNIIDYDHNSSGDLIWAKDSQLNKWDYPRNTDGTLDKVTDPLNNLTDYSYTTKGELQTIDFPGTVLGNVDFTYDGLSRMKTMEDGKNQTMTYTYDKIDRLVQIDLHGGGTIAYTYDKDGNLKKRVDPTGTYDFVYDDLNRLKEKILPGGTTITFGYDKVGNLTSLQNGSGTTTYAYDETNNVISIQEPGAADDIVLNYNENNVRNSITYPNGVVVNFTLDDSSRITKVKAVKSGTPIYEVDWSYTHPTTGLDTGLRQDMTDVNALPDVKTDYDYDHLNRLTDSEIISGGSTHYEYVYDKVGNLTKKIVDGGTPTWYEHGEDNRLCWSISQASDPPETCSGEPAGNEIDYTYDANGNLLTSSEGLELTYNSRNQTVTMKPPGGATANFVYADATQDERIQAGQDSFTNDLLGLATKTRSGNTIYYTRDPEGMILGSKINTSRYYYVHDSLGSVVGLTGPSGNMVNTYSYDPYGSVTASGTVDNPFQFAGGYYDSLTQFTKFGTRYYAAAFQRWTQMDPETGRLKDPLTLNRYLYVSSDPVNGTDPTGRQECSDYPAAEDAAYDVLFVILAAAYLTGTSASFGFALAIGMEIGLEIVYFSYCIA